MRKLVRFFIAFWSFCLLFVSTENFVPKAYADSTMTASESCVEFIKKVEGFSAKPYYDYKQHTVGYGTKCPDNKYLDYLANGIPKEDAEVLLRETIRDLENTLHKKLIEPYNLSINQHQFDALISFSFNLGTSWMTYDSTLRNAILRNANEDELVYAFSLYCTAGGNYLSGLVGRRLDEANMYLNGVYSKTVSDAYGYVFYDPNGGSLTYRVQGYICEHNSAPAAPAVRTGDVFLGWYTDITGGSLVTELNKSVRGKTLFARWQSSENDETEDSPSTIINVTGDVVNIRKGPGTNYGIAAQVSQGDTLLVSHTTELSGRKWGKVNSGWICLEYTNYDAVINGTAPDLKPNGTPSDEATVPDQDSDTNKPDTLPDKQEVITGTVRVNDLLRIRSGPDTTYSTVGYLTNGRSVEILELRIAGTMVWGRIDRGWVSMDYIATDLDNSDSDTNQDSETESTPETEPEQEPDDTQPPETEAPQETAPPAEKPESTAIFGTITADALRIRSGPGTEHSIVGFHYQNDKVVISEKVLVNSTYWGKTRTGWINMDYVSTGSGNEEAPSSQEGKEMTVIADCLRVRKEIGTDSRIAALLYYGDKVTVLETTTVDGVSWGKVKSGWICMDYVN